ncbi:lactate utilization protein [Cetobacterium sp.]|uniref:lactate utilization protein n=1 Tax=Cetobacterium sp. TaxID=2071632 RepID=UPI0025BEB348|nr:lactate utilization protein [Cetobacterium sp.]
MKEIKKNIRQKEISDLIDTLSKKNYTPIYADNLNEARNIILDLIPNGSSIALGGSVTINELNLIDIFKSDEYKLFDRYNQPDWPSTVECMRQGLLADYFVTSTNAITKNGELIQTDSGGNRVASLLYGPKNAIVICGINKLVDSYQDGLKRIKEFVGPLNSKRINHKTPCNISGKCENCNTKQRICNFTTIMKSGERTDGKTFVIIINEEVGY